MSSRILIENLAFSYTGQALDGVFSNINITLEKGEVFCLLGPNGSGKSTLLKCVVNLLSPLGGTVFIDDQAANTMSAAQIAGKIGFVPQSLVSAFPFTVSDIVVMGRASKIGLMSSPSLSDRKKAADAMERIGISHLAVRPCNRLSGGEWQLVLIARALTQSPGVLILDEPTSHLDLGNQVRILEVVDSLSKEGITIAMASHFPDHAFLNADKVGILKDGSMAVLGDPDTVLTEQVLADSYHISVRVLSLSEGIDRKICVPQLRHLNKGSKDVRQ